MYAAKQGTEDTDDEEYAVTLRGFCECYALMTEERICIKTYLSPENRFLISDRGRSCPQIFFDGVLLFVEVVC